MKVFSKITNRKNNRIYVDRKRKISRKSIAAIIAISVVVVAITAIICYIAFNKDRFIYEYMLYDHIQYKGNDYYQAKDQHYRPSDEGEQRGPVYLVNKSSKVISWNIYDAYVNTGYEGEAEEIYLFFDSATYIRGDYRNTSD